MEKIIIDNLEAIREICRRHYVKQLWVFGSATGVGIDGNPFGLQSDVDLLVEFEEKIYDFKLYDCADIYFDMIDALETLLDRKVDLVSVRAIRSERFRKYVEQQRQELYVA